MPAPLEDAVSQLNFHHLRYFWLVAREGSLSATARRLEVAQSSVSAQIAKLEAHLGEPLFRREGRSLVLTEAGHLVHAYADDIFGRGAQLLATLRSGRHHSDLLRIGAVATLSRNFQTSFLAPLFASPDARLRIASAPFEDLLARLDAMEIDLVLSNRPPAREGLRTQLVAQQQVSLIGHPRAAPLRFPDDLTEVPLLLPPADSGIRATFDALCGQHGVQVEPVAEVDDMALLRLLARDHDLVALMPSVVVRDELSSGALQELVVVPELMERFYATTDDRRFHHPLVDELLARDAGEILAG